MDNFSGEIKSVKLDLKACSVSVVAEESSGLKGISYTGPKDLEPDAEFADRARDLGTAPACAA